MGLQLMYSFHHIVMNEKATQLGGLFYGYKIHLI